MIKKIIKKMLPFIFKDKPDVENYNQQDWDKQYTSGRWSYLDQISELAHYSVIVGYCQHLFPDGSILDVGCGEGLLQQRLSLLPYKKYTGIDMSAVAIKNANNKYADDRTEFYTADGSSYSNDSRYNLIVFNESLYCFNDAVKVINHYKKMLKKDGVFIISMHVQEVSNYHWPNIEKHFNVIDKIHLTNKEDISWNCAVVKPIN